MVEAVYTQQAGKASITACARDWVNCASFANFGEGARLREAMVLAELGEERERVETIKKSLNTQQSQEAGSTGFAGTGCPKLGEAAVSSNRWTEMGCFAEHRKGKEPYASVHCDFERCGDFTFRGRLQAGRRQVRLRGTAGRRPHVFADGYLYLSDHERCANHKRHANHERHANAQHCCSRHTCRHHQVIELGIGH